jgi:hypothetical protein
MLTMMQDLEELAVKLLETARKLAPGAVRHDALREIGRLRAQISALQAPALRPHADCGQRTCRSQSTKF